MRHMTFIVLVASILSSACELCEKDISVCIPPQEDVENPDENPPPADEEEYTCSVQEVEVDGRCVSDADGDGVRQTDDEWNPIDNCPELANPDQLDRDGDGIGAACENTTIFTWHRNGEAFAELTALVSLEGICVDHNEDFVFSVDTQNYEWQELDELETIDMVIPYGDWPTAVKCYVLIRQNEQEASDTGVPSPGFGNYLLSDTVYDAPIVADGLFEGWWRMDLYPDPPAVN